MECTFVSLSIASGLCQLRYGIHTPHSMCTHGCAASSVGEKQPVRCPHTKHAAELGGTPDAHRRHCHESDTASADAADTSTPQHGACTSSWQRLQCKSGSSLHTRHTQHARRVADEEEEEERREEEAEEERAEVAEGWNERCGETGGDGVR